MSKNPWLRLYSRIIDDEKLRLLAFEDRWHFVALLCLKSDCLLDEPDSELRTRKIAVKMGLQVREVEEVGRRLSEVGLIDKLMRPIKFDELQFKTDSSKSRVQAYRDRKKACNEDVTLQGRYGNGSVTAQEEEEEEEKEEEEKEKKKRATFTPPTEKELHDFFMELGWQNDQGLQARTMIDHYRQQGWKLKGGNKMIDWKAAGRNWLRRQQQWENRK
jgi:hypothetical protein